MSSSPFKQPGAPHFLATTLKRASRRFSRSGRLSSKATDPERLTREETMRKYGRFPVRSAEEAAELISHGATLGIGGFTDPGCPHSVPRALAQRARGFHERGKPFQVRILSGAEAGPAVDVDLPQADAVSFRMPFQLEKPCRDAINARKIDFADVHLSHCSQQIFEGCFGKIDFAVIEASDISDDGRVSFTTAIGNGPTYLQLAEKIVIEI